MRICIVSDQTFPAWGGEGVATQNLCRKLSQRGHYILLLTSNVPHPPEVEGIDIVRFPSFFIPRKGYFSIAFFPKIISILKNKNIQIVHVNLPTFLGWQALLAARHLDIPKVAGFHVQVGNVIPFSSFCFSLLSKLLEIWFSYFYRSFNLLISPSNLGKIILSRYCPGKVEVVSNGVDLSIFNLSVVSSQEGKKFRDKFNLGREFFLLYVGRLSREKNVGYLLQIIRSLKKKNVKVKLVVVGEGELKNNLKKKSCATGLDDTVIFTGFLPDKELLCAYKEADIFILPSFYELQSIVVLEAMAMGNAILVGDSNQNAARELVKEGKNGYLFSLENPEDAAEKIKLILSSDKLRKSFQETSLRLVKEHDIEKSISKIEKFYHQLLTS